MSTNVVVEISPETTTRPVLTRVSQATRPSGSSAMTASRTPSEIWSAILSGWPSVTDSDVNRYSLSESWFMGSQRVAAVAVSASSGSGLGARVAARLAFVEVDDQRHAVHPVPRAQAVLDEVRVVACDAIARVDLDREARRRGLELGHVEQLEPVALLGRRLARLGDLGQEAVELRGGDAVVHPLAEDDRLVEDALDVAPRLGAGGQDLRAQAQLLGHARALVVEVGLVHRGDVPLVQHQGRGAALLHPQLGDAQVLARDAVVRVADDDDDVGALDRALGAQRRVVLDGVGDLGLAAQPRGVDDHELAPVDLERQVDRVARGPGHVGDDHALVAQQLVDEGRLADVGAPDDGQADGVVLFVGLVALVGQRLGHAIEQVADVEPLRGRHRQRIAEAERVEVGGQRHVAHRVDLVGREDDGALPAAQDVGELLVTGPAPGARVDDEDRRNGIVERGLGLLADRAGDRVDVEEVHAPGVDQVEAPAVPLAGDLVAIARDARALVDDRRARAGQAVDERGLADVGIADDRALAGLPVPTAPTIRSTTSSMPRPVVSTSTASGAATIGECSRLASRWSRSRTSLTGTPRRRARSSSSAVSHTLSSASGATTVPMSRPSATQSPLAMSARCLSSRAARTVGSAARREASWEISGVRMAALTSRPSSSTRSPSKRISRSLGSLAPDSATAR